MTFDVKYTPWPELSATYASWSPKISSSSVVVGLGTPCKSASKPKNIRGVSVPRTSASAAAKIFLQSSQLGATHGAMYRAGGIIDMPESTGWLCGSIKPGSSAAAPVSMSSAPGNAALASASEPTATILPPETATASARG